MLLAIKDEARSNLKDEENAFLLDNSYGEETMEELTTAVMLMDRIQPADGNADTVPSYDANAVSEVNASSKVHEQLSKKAFKERENQYLEDIVDLEEKLSSHDRIVYKMGQSIQTIHMLRKKLNKVYDPFLKAGLGYKNPECLKKAIATQPKMYDGERLHSAKLTIDSPNSEKNLEDAEESRLKMRNKMVQINYGKLNALYETFVPQQEFSVEQTYFSIPSTSNNGSESKEVTLDFQFQKCQKRKNELLKAELEKSSSDSKDIQANLLKRIKILENNLKRISTKRTKTKPKRTKPSTEWKEREKVKVNKVKVKPEKSKSKTEPKPKKS
ncbi:hypothetical protein Tco_0703524 [Tanacetum coccineum]|uniref:Uncharacterized protein n=1 Tax=Tanacetum coccineum TaxID=301880 RepID=A0ABQ4Y0Z6_9ASTR